MKIAAVERDIGRIGTSQESSFRLKATSKAFKILSSGLYRDKIRAIVRELSCNAYDAHKAAGREDIPFSVHLPNALEPYFTIRDEGIGLSHDDVVTVCTTYFESTKTDSNDFIGALGLGMKSPFSYVDSFTLISRHGGMKRTYAMFIGEDGCPMVTLMGEPEPTDEHNGVEITMPVATYRDFAEFRDRASQVFAHFDPKPIVTGNADYAPQHFDVVLEGDGWRVMRQRTMAQAVMGKVAYPIMASSAKVQDEQLSSLLSADIHIDFPIGSLDVTAGREELSYDDKITIPALHKRLSEVMVDLGRVISERAAACESEYDVRRLIKELGDTTLRGFVPKTVTWRGKAISSHYFVLTGEDFEDLRITMLTPSYRGNSWKVSYTDFNKNTTFSIQPSPRVKLFRASTKPTIGRVRYWLSTRRSEFDSVYIIDGKNADDALAALDGFPVTKADTLDKVPVSRTRARVRMFSPGYIHSNPLPTPRYLTDVEVDMATGGYFVVTRNGLVTGLSGGDEPEDSANTEFQALWSAVGHAKLWDPHKKPVYFVPWSIRTDFEADGWTPWIEHITGIAVNKINTTLTPEVFGRATSFTAFQSNVANGNGFRLIKELNLPEEHPFVDLLDTMRVYQKAATQVESLEKLAAALKLNFDAPTGIIDLTSSWVKQYQRYPMLEYVHQTYRHWYNAEDKARIRDYIALVDKQLNK